MQTTLNNVKPVLQTLLLDELFASSKVVKISDEFFAHGLVFHVNDFVYLRSTSSSQLEIGQVVQVENKHLSMEASVKVNVYEESKCHGHYVSAI